MYTTFFQCRVLWYIKNLSVINFREESGVSADQSTCWEKMLYSYSGNKCIMWCILLSSLTGHSWPHYNILLPLLRQTRPVSTSYVLWACLTLFRLWWRSVKGNLLKFTHHLQGDELECEKIWIMSEDACRIIVRLRYSMSTPSGSCWVAFSCFQGSVTRWSKDVNSSL